MSVSQWAALRRAPRELAVMIVAKALVSYSYFAVAQVFVLFLTDQHGYGDREAAALYGYLGLAALLFGIATGPVIDRIGVRRSLVLGALVAGIGMVMMAMSLERVTLLIAVLLVMPFGLALGMPIPDIGCQLYTYDGNRLLAFAIIYAWMNVGASFAGLAYDGFRFYGPTHGFLLLNGTPVSAERSLILSAAVVACFSGLFAALLVRDITVHADGHVTVAPATESSALASTRARPPLRWYWENTFKKRAFWQVVVFTATFAFVRQTYRQFDMTLGKWALRVLGPRAPIGLFYAVNPIIIVVMSPVSALVLAGFNPYTMQIVGSLFSSLALFFMAGDVSELLVVCTMALFTVGEAMYSSQTTPMVLAIAPQALRATYSILASVPIFASALVSAWMSGALLDTYCPAPIGIGAANGGDAHDAMRRCGLVWVWVAGVALLTPLLLLALRHWIYTDDVRYKIDIALKRYKDGERPAAPVDDHDAAAVAATDIEFTALDRLAGD